MPSAWEVSGLIISQTNRSERIKALSKAFYADSSDFVPKLPFQCGAARSHSDDCALAMPGKGKLLMNGWNEEGRGVSWSLAGRKSGNFGIRRGRDVTGQTGTPRNISDIRPSPISKHKFAQAFRSLGADRSSDENSESIWPYLPFVWLLPVPFLIHTNWRVKPPS